MSSARFAERFFAEVSRYERLATLGRGGMGIVFKVRDRELDEVIAIKALSPEFRESELDLLTRFKQEIMLNRKIKHPNVARIYDFGMAGDYPYITMEYIPGKDLKTRILERGRIPPPEAVGILRQIVKGTRAAHDVGIVHRDLKPQNVMVDDAGAVAILDFGLARGKSNQHLTASSLVLGTPQYLSPEQALGGAAEPRSDLYAIGIIAFEMLTGTLPFDGESPVATAMMQVNNPVPDTLSRCPDVPAPLAQLVLRLLAKKPEDRLAGAAALENQLLVVEEILAASPFVEAPSPEGIGEGLALDLDRAFEALETGETGLPPVDATPIVPHRVRSARPPVTIETRPGTRAAPAAGSAAPPAPAPPGPRPTAAAIVPKAPPPAPRAAEKTVARKKAPVVLIVDAEKEGLGLAAEAFRISGCQPVLAQSGPEALELLLRWGIDLVILDVQLPGGMDGYDTARVIKSRPETASVPILLATSRLDRTVLAWGTQLGAADVLKKPIPPGSLVWKSWQLLSRCGYTPPAASVYGSTTGGGALPTGGTR